LAESSITAHELFSRAVADFNRDAADEERALVHGDTYPHAFLVAPTLQEDGLPLSIGFIDWESARTGRGVSGDFAPAAAYFALMETAAAYRSETMACAASKSALACIRKFLSTLISQYRAMSRQEGALWAKAGAVSSPADPRGFIVRSAMIAHGTEIIRRALTMRWICGRAKCFEGGDLEKSKSQCELNQTMIRRGVWYLHSARADMLEFSRPENWQRLQIGQIEGFWLLDLFQ
jgi:hypothetical protein